MGGGEYKIRRGHNDSRIRTYANIRTQTSYHALKKPSKQTLKGQALNSRECTEINLNSLICELRLKPSQILSSPQPNQH